MNDELWSAEAAKRPDIETMQLPANAILSERVMQRASPARVASTAIADRRRGISDLERASVALAHAVQYLSSEQRAGRCTSVRGNRHAIKILCECAEGLTRMEQREPNREAMNTWLAGARPAFDHSSGERPAAK